MADYDIFREQLAMSVLWCRRHAPGAEHMELNNVKKSVTNFVGVGEVSFMSNGAVSDFSYLLNALRKQKNNPTFQIIMKTCPQDSDYIAEGSLCSNHY